MYLFANMVILFFTLPSNIYFISSKGVLTNKVVDCSLTVLAAILAKYQVLGLPAIVYEDGLITLPYNLTVTRL